MNTTTHSSSYTVADVGKVIDSFTSDYHMIAQATGLRDQNHVTKVARDVKLMAQRGYLREVSIVLSNKAGAVVRANKYTVSTQASGWAVDRPGNNLWPRSPDGNLGIVVSYSDAWHSLTDQQRQAFRDNECSISWTTSNVDTSFPGLFHDIDRHYASEAYGLERSSFGATNQ